MPRSGFSTLNGMNHNLKKRSSQKLLFLDFENLLSKDIFFYIQNLPRILQNLVRSSDPPSVYFNPSPPPSPHAPPLFPALLEILEISTPPPHPIRDPRVPILM